MYSGYERAAWAAIIGYADENAETAEGCSYPMNPELLYYYG